jgi:MFS family permease
MCQGLLFTINSIYMMVTGLVAVGLAPEASWASIPLGLFITGAAITTIPASLLMRRIGRRLGFMIGAAIGFHGGVVAAVALAIGSFWLLCVASVIMGAYFAFCQYFRMAITEVASGPFRQHAVSFVLAGGVLSGVAAPETAKYTQDLFAPLAFLGTYVAVSFFAYVMMLLLAFLDIPPLTESQRRDRGRPLSVIAAQPRFIVAVLAGMVSWAAMNIVMAGTPLAMAACSYPFSDAAFVMGSHNVAMFAPGFFTGWMINRFGVFNVMLWGAAILVGSVAALVSGIELWNFWWAGALVGGGWCFLYVGSSILLSECCTISEQGKTQGLNDFLVFTAQAIGTFASGFLLYGIGWSAVGWAMAPMIVVTAAATTWLAVRERTLAPRLRVAD